MNNSQIDYLKKIQAQLQIFREVLQLGFEEKPLEHHEEDENRLKFVRKPSDQVPTLEAVVDYSRFGYHVGINSIPYDTKYHRHTGSPIARELVVDQLKQYIAEVVSQDTK